MMPNTCRSTMLCHWLLMALTLTLLGSQAFVIPSNRPRNSIVAPRRFQNSASDPESTSPLVQPVLLNDISASFPLHHTSGTNKQDRMMLPEKQIRKENDKSSLVIPMSTTSKKQRTKAANKWNISSWLSLRIRSFQKQRPGVNFRAALFTASAVATGIVLRTPNHTSRQLQQVASQWIRHRGFQGLAALGRTVAYGWAVLVAYPRLLDRRAAERKERRREKELDRRRTELQALAAELSRLQHQATTLDAEIRSFRREIISLKAAGALKQSNNHDGSNSDVKNTSNSMHSEIQQAIDDEMTHLLQLRSDTQAALVAARQTWAEARAQSPPEAWPGSMPT